MTEAPVPTPDAPVSSVPEAPPPVETVQIPEAPAAHRKHSGCLTAFLALAIVGNAIIAVITWMMAGDMPSSYQPLMMLAGLLNLVGVAFAIAIYRWKKWGVYGYIAVIGIGIIISLVAGDLVSAARGLIPIGLLAALIRPSWPHMD